MAAEASPAFQFYVKEWRSSRAIMRMSFAERGMYLEMLLEQWENHLLPDSPEGCAEAIGGRPSEWKRAWSTLRRNFVVCESGDKIFNIRLENERKKQKSHHKRSEDRGRAGAAARWAKAKDSTKPPEPDRPSIQQASTVDAQSISGNGFALSIPSSIPIATADTRVTPKASGKSSGRIFLHRWQLDALIDTLGPHAEDFGLDEWLDVLNQRIAGQALPPDPWKFVQSEIHAEIGRRGLAVAEPAPSAPTNKRIAGLVAGGEAFLRRVAEQKAQGRA